MIRKYAEWTLSRLRYSTDEEKNFATKESREMDEYRDYENRMHEKVVEHIRETEGKVKHLKFFKAFEWVLFLVPVMISFYSNVYTELSYAPGDFSWVDVMRFILNTLIMYLAVQLYDTDLSATLLPEKCMIPFTVLAVLYNATISLGGFVSSIFIYMMIFGMLRLVQQYAPYVASLTGSGRAVQSSGVFAGGDVRYMAGAFTMFMFLPYTLLGFGLGMMVSTILFLVIEKTPRNSFVSAGMFMSCGVAVGIIVRCLVYHL